MQKIDLATGAATLLSVQGNVPELSWPCGIAYDSRRDRVVLSSLGGVGYLYAYDPASNAWSVLADMNNIDLCALTYSAREDCFYGLATVGGGEGNPQVQQFDPAGKLTNTLALSEPIAISRAPTGAAQLAMVGKNLAILATQGGGNAPGIQGMRCVVVDLGTGQVISSNQTSPQVAPATDFDPKEVDRLWRLMGSADATEAEQATNRLIAGGDKAVEPLATRLKAPVAALSDERVKQLIDALGSADPDARERATTDLICAGDSVDKPVRAAMQGDVSPEAQSRLKLVLSDISEKEAGDTRSIAQVRRESESVRVLREIGTPSAVERLIELSADRNENRAKVAEEARAVLRQI